MSQDQEPSSSQFSLPPEKIDAKSTVINKVNSSKLLETDQVARQNASPHQITPLHRPLRFWTKHWDWSFFKRGLFWGGLISVTAVVSALAGAALTKIDVVEQAISSRIASKTPAASDPYANFLAHPVNILLVETEAPSDGMLETADDFKGKSKTILLAKFHPGLESVEIVSIPPNSQVNLAENGPSTIQDAYRIGGKNLLAQAVQQLTTSTKIDFYIKASPRTFRQLSASGRINLRDCDIRLRDCSDRKEQILRQQTALETIRQRLNVPAYLASFKTALAETEPNLDTNLATGEMFALAKFLKGLEPENLEINLVTNYIPGQALAKDSQPKKVAQSKYHRERNWSRVNGSVEQNPFQFRPIAVQNTTDNPELGIQVVAYLRHRQFRDVYLVEHTPLRLSRTRLVANSNQIPTAKYLQKIMGFGHLEPIEYQDSEPLTLQVGQDAMYLPTNYRSFRY